MSNINVGTPDPILVTLGEVGFSRHWVVTPAGNAPIAGTTILITDLTRVERKPRCRSAANGLTSSTLLVTRIQAAL